MNSNQNTAGENWTKDDLKVYIMLYCANADSILDDEEIEFIKEKTNNPKYKALRKEFDKDNDYQGTQKMEAAIKRLGYNETQIVDLINDLKELFWADGKFDSIENAILKHIKRIFKS